MRSLFILVRLPTGSLFVKECATSNTHGSLMDREPTMKRERHESGSKPICGFFYRGALGEAAAWRLARILRLPACFSKPSQRARGFGKDLVRDKNIVVGVLAVPAYFHLT